MSNSAKLSSVSVEQTYPDPNRPIGPFLFAELDGQPAEVSRLLHRRGMLLKCMESVKRASIPCSAGDVSRTGQ
jgi:hypothetical protein